MATSQRLSVTVYFDSTELERFSLLAARQDRPRVRVLRDAALRGLLEMETEQLVKEQKS